MGGGGVSADAESEVKLNDTADALLGFGMLGSACRVSVDGRGRRSNQGHRRCWSAFTAAGVWAASQQGLALMG